MTLKVILVHVEFDAQTLVQSKTISYGAIMLPHYRLSSIFLADPVLGLGLSALHGD